MLFIFDKLWYCENTASGSLKCGMRNAECGMRNAECGVRNAECGVRNAELPSSRVWRPALRGGAVKPSQTKCPRIEEEDDDEDENDSLARCGAVKVGQTWSNQIGDEEARPLPGPSMNRRSELKALKDWKDLELNSLTLTLIPALPPRRGRNGSSGLPDQNN